MCKVYDGDLFLFSCDEVEAEMYAEQGFKIVKGNE